MAPPLLTFISLTDGGVRTRMVPEWGCRERSTRLPPWQRPIRLRFPKVPGRIRRGRRAESTALPFLADGPYDESAADVARRFGTGLAVEVAAEERTKPSCCE